MNWVLNAPMLKG